MAKFIRLRNLLLAICSTVLIFFNESFSVNDHRKEFHAHKINFVSILIVSNTNWSSINTGSGAGGQPGCADDITISGNAILTIDVNNAQCQNLFINKNDDATSSQLKFNAGSQLSVCADVIVGSSLGTARAGVLDMTSGGVLKLNGSFTLTPSLSNFLPGTGTIEYAGATAQTVLSTTYNNLSTSGSLAKTLAGALALNGNLSIGSGTTLDVSIGNNFPISLMGDWINNGIFTQRTGIVTFKGVSQSIKGATTTAFNTITILNGSIVTGLTASTASIANINSGGKYIQTAGTAVLGSSSKNFASGSSYELQLTTASGFIFSGSTYGNLIINFSGSSGINTNGVLTTVANDLVIRNTGTSAFRFASSQSPTININGSLKIDAGAVEVATTTGVPIINVGNNFEQTGGSFKLSLSSTGGQQLNVNGNILLSGGTFQPMASTGIPTINLKSDWINNGGNFITGSTTINFNGSITQNITGNSSTTFNNLSLNNAAGVTLNTVDATVSGVLNFITGKLSTATKKLILGGSATISGAGTSKYVIGVLRKNIQAATNYSFVFPVGDNLSYAPVSIDFSGTTTAGSLDVLSNMLGSPPALASGLSQTKYISRKWTLTNTSVSGFTSYSATFNFPDADKIGSPNTANFVTRKFNGTNWSATTTGALTSNSTQATGLTSFSDFEIGEADCNFPNVSNFSITASSTCAGSSAPVLINSSSLVNGNYAVNYDLTGTNNYPNNNSAFTINSSIGNFNTIPLSNSGSTILQLNSISAGNCLAAVSSNSIFLVNASTTGDTSAIACDSFSWYGVKYFSSSSPSHSFINSAGCDSIVTLHLTVKHSTNGEVTVAACENYLWNGTVYTTPGDKTHLFPNGNSVGCDSTATLHLTINHRTSGQQTVVACDSYAWNGTVYTTSGDKPYLFPNGNSSGCDSTATLHLTINHSTSSQQTVIACDSYTWNGTVYTTSGDKTQSFPNGNSIGCDSTATLHLTINHSTSGQETVIACENYLWNGTVYSTSGDKTHTFLNGNAVGCDSIATLHLTINHSTSGQQTVVACDSYTWNGTVYTTSGDKTQSFPNGSSAGCDSTATLHLTINHSASGQEAVIACDSYIWNGTVYTTSGDKTHIFLNGNAVGCDSTATLHLTINHSTSGQQTVVACESYTWNGITYTTSGDKIHLFPNGNSVGCDSTATLHLTINHSTSGQQTVVACDSYTWNGITYTTSGDKIHLFPNGNSVGCDSTATLHLTINSPCNSCSNNPKPVVTVMNCSANSIPVNSSITLNGSFTDNVSGGPYTVDIDWNDGTIHSILNIANSNSTQYNFSATHNYTTSNVYEIKVRVTDGCNAISDIVSGTSTWQYLAVYVTGNDFTTMGGWFNAPAGSYAANPQFTGKVNMGNVVRPNNPNNKGELELNINDQDFYVHSISPTNWDYLTISGCCLATFKGSVTINNSGNYKILVSQTDKNVNCNGFNGNNKIRVKIWNPLTNDIFFDTQPGDPDNALPTLALNGGAIQVHKPSCNVSIKTTETKEQSTTRQTDDLLINIHPNPTENNFVMNIQSNSDELILIRISDVTGKIITALKTKPAINLTFGQHLKTGIYFAEIRQGARKKIIKLVKQ